MTAALPPDPAEVTEGDRAKAAELLDRTLHPGVVRDYLPLGERIAAALAAERAAVTRPLLALLEPGDPNARMDAYYYGFERTGVGIIDAILSAVAQAGKSYHGTDMWADEDEWTKPSHEQRIQAAADEAATAIRAAVAAALGETGGGQ